MVPLNILDWIGLTNKSFKVLNNNHPEVFIGTNNISSSISISSTSQLVIEDRKLSTLI